MILFNKKLVNKISPVMNMLSELQEILYLEAAEPNLRGNNWMLNPDKEQDSDTLERINDLADKYGLRPNKIARFK